jgi:hypothetical protein
MYMECIAPVDWEKLNRSWAPICLMDPNITIIKTVQDQPLKHIDPKMACLRIYVSDEDAEYLMLKYEKEHSYIFIKV